jgi:hypothetical protein
MAVDAVLLPAYRVTGDQHYLLAAMKFYNQAQLHKHVTDFQGGWNMQALLYGLDGLTELASYSEISAEERKAYAEMARSIMQQIVGWQLDAPGRKLFDGNGGVVTGMISANDLPGTNYKDVGLNAWVARLLMQGLFDEETYQLQAAQQ